jgi:hypothetical protein
VEKLEEKLDGLVTLLKSSQESKLSNNPPVPGPFDTSPINSTTAANSNAVSQSCYEGIPGQAWSHIGVTNGSTHSSTQISQTPGQETVTSNTIPITVCSPDSSMSEGIEFTIDQANVLLNRFRDHLAPFCPFIVVPPSISAQDLNRDRPFLLKSILAVASCVSSQQVPLGKWLIKQLADRMAVNGERNLDLLLGVLTYTGWIINQLSNGFSLQQITTLLSLGMTLVFDLGLNRPPRESWSKNLFEIALRETNNSAFSRHSINIKGPRTLEERRAFLGMFFLSSAFVSYPFRHGLPNSKIFLGHRSSSDSK